MKGLSDERKCGLKESSALCARQLSCVIDSREVIHQACLTVRWGEILALLGHSGAGKTTLLQCLCGMRSFDKGTLELDGQIWPSLSFPVARQKGMATLMQNFALATHLDVAANVWLGNEPTRWKFFIHRQRMVEQTTAMLNQWGFALPATGVPVGHLSKGQQQAVALLRALASGGKIFLLDEPVVALGHYERKRFFDILATLRQRGLAVICAFHSVADAVQLADRLIIIRQGHTTDVGPVNSLDPVKLLTLMG